MQRDLFVDSNHTQETAQIPIGNNLTNVNTRTLNPSTGTIAYDATMDKVVFATSLGTWTVIAGSGTGDVTGPGTTTAGEIAVYGDASGNIIANSNLLVSGDDISVKTGPGPVTINGATVGTGNVISTAVGATNALATYVSNNRNIQAVTGVTLTGTTMTGLTVLSGKTVANLVESTAVGATNAIATYNGANRIVQAVTGVTLTGTTMTGLTVLSGKTVANLVESTAVGVANAIAIYNGANRIIQSNPATAITIPSANNITNVNTLVTTLAVSKTVADIITNAANGTNGVLAMFTGAKTIANATGNINVTDLITSTTGGTLDHIAIFGPGAKNIKDSGVIIAGGGTAITNLTSIQGGATNKTVENIVTSAANGVINAIPVYNATIAKSIVASAVSIIGTDLLNVTTVATPTGPRTVTIASIVEGPVTSVDNTIVRFNGTSGKQIQGTSAVISDTGIYGTTLTTGVPTLATDILPVVMDSTGLLGVFQMPETMNTAGSSIIIVPNVAVDVPFTFTTVGAGISPVQGIKTTVVNTNFSPHIAVTQTGNGGPPTFFTDFNIDGLGTYLFTARIQIKQSAGTAGNVSYQLMFNTGTFTPPDFITTCNCVSGSAGTLTSIDNAFIVLPGIIIKNTVGSDTFNLYVTANNASGGGTFTVSTVQFEMIYIPVAIGPI